MVRSGSICPRYVTTDATTLRTVHEHSGWVYQICVPVLRNALGGSADGLRLLACIRAYVELDLLASFEVHTEETIKYSRKVAKEFLKLANVSRSSRIWQTDERN